MKIALIYPAEDLFTPSINCLSAYLRERGHDTVIILLPWSFTDRKLDDRNSFLYPYPTKVLEQVAELCSTSDLIGISMMTCHFDNAVHITSFLRKRLHLPIIWGGIHPTLRPDECLEYADMVCVGEGEISLSQLASEMSNGRAWESLSIPGIYKSGDSHPTPFLPGPIIRNLDELPLPDYDLDHQFVLYEQSVVRLNSSLLAKCLGYNLRAVFSRGCPNACKFCANSALRKLYHHKLPLRWRNVDNMIKELKLALEVMPQLKEVILSDEAFLVRPIENIRSFALRYREEIGLPLKFITDPRSINESKLRLLMKAGLNEIGIGVQSGCDRVRREIYSRAESLDNILLASDCLKQMEEETKKRITTRYDFILDNPWETEQEVEDSIRFCMKLKRPYHLMLFSLTFFPGTELYTRARDEGIITDDLNQVYRRSSLTPRHTYLNGVFKTLQFGAPNWVAALLLQRYIRRLSPVWVAYSVAYAFWATRAFRRLLRYAARGDWKLMRPLLHAGLSRLWGMLKKGSPDSQRPRFYGSPGNICEVST
jgi:anaerobic magnesium-protoporphyrin IX monomethyl ester cyclase